MMIAGSVRLPDFFIVGAPKSATTALWAYFAQHPAMQMSEPKEPHYFAGDFPNSIITKSWDEYAALFGDISSSIVAGEASVWYLYSELDVARIRQVVPNAKIIVMLRNPVDAAYSLYNHKLVTFDEDVRDFYDAWHLNEARTAGSNIPASCRESRHILYKTVYSYGYQLERLFGHFARTDVFVGTFEEFVSNPRATYQRMLAFLGVPDDGRIDFARVNPNKQHRHGLAETAMRAVATWKRRGSALSRTVDAASKALVGPRRRNAVVSRMLRRNLNRGKIAPLDPIGRRDLLRQMQREVRQVELLINRDLSAWRA